MNFGPAGTNGWSDILLVVLTIVVTGAVSFAVFLGCFYRLRREQRRMQRKIIQAIGQAARGQDAPFLSGQDAASLGELVAQFKVNQGRQVVSLLEADGKRFIHVDGELSGPERAKMVRYLKSEGFMS